MAEVTTMLLKVDLHCHKCYKKVKKLLCKYPEIRDQVYDEKQNTVTIKVVYCCPEILMKKLSDKGGKSIQSIEIKPPSKPKETEKKKEADKEKPKETEKKTDAEKPGDPKPTKPKVVIVDPPPKQKPETAKAPKTAPAPAPTSKAPETAPAPAPTSKALVTVPTPEAHVLAPIPKAAAAAPGYPFGVYCNEYYGGHGGGPFQRLGYERLVCYDGYYGRPVYDSWGGSDGGWSRGHYRGWGFFL